MKKIFVLILMLFITGCSLDKVTVNQDYNHYLSVLENTTDCIEPTDYKINIEFEKFTDKEYIYQVIIDSAIKELDNIRVLVTHDAKTKDVFPSVGFFDSTYNLSNIKTKNTIKGINLVGYIPFDSIKDSINIKVLVIYGENNITNCYITNLDRK